MANSLNTSSLISFSTGKPGQDVGVFCLELFSALEISLFRSQKALLARDLSSILQGTAEQATLCKEISTLLRTDVLAIPEFREQLSPSALRILQLARVQAALLAKAQRSLQMIARLAGALETSYAPPPWRGGLPISGLRIEKDPPAKCRA